MSAERWSRIWVRSMALRVGAFVAMLLVFGLIFSLGVRELWLYGHQGWNGARRGVAGINYNRYGFVETRFGPVENFGHAEPDDYRYYWHHPVLIHNLVGLSFQTFGVHEWAARLVPIACSLITMLLLFLLALRWWGTAGAVVASATFIFLPISGFYGKFVNHEPLVLMLGMLLFWLRVRFEDHRRWRTVIAAAALVLVGSFSDWPFFFILGAYGVVELAVQLTRWRRDRDLRFFVVVTVTGALGLFLVTWYLTTLEGEGLKGFAKLFSDRSTGGGKGTYGLKHLWERREWYLDLYTPIALASGAMWTVLLPLRALLRRLRSFDALIAGSLIAGGGWIIVFAQAAYIHEYWSFYLIPFAALSTAWVALSLGRLFGRLRPEFGVAVLAAFLGVFVVWGGVEILARQASPSDVGREAPEFRFRHMIFARWVAERSDPDDTVLVQRDFPLLFQVGFYLDRRTVNVTLDEHFRRLHNARGRRYLLLDRSHLPEKAEKRILRVLSERYPVVFFDRFCLFDLRAKDNRGESIEAYRIALQPWTLGWTWFVSGVYPPYTIERSEADAFQWALTLGLDAAARRLAPGIERPAAEPQEDADAERRRLRDWAAWHNAQVALGRPAGAVYDALSEALGPERNIAIGEQATLLGASLAGYQGRRAAITLVVLARRDGGQSLRSWMRRRAVSAVFGIRAFGLNASERVWHSFDPPPSAWQAGMMYVDTYPIPLEGWPQELSFFLDREPRKEERLLQAKGASAGTEKLGLLDLDAPALTLRPLGAPGPKTRRYDAKHPFAWIRQAAPACAPDAKAKVAELDVACLDALLPSLDIGADLRLTGEDTIRLRGVRVVGRQARDVWVDALFTVERRVKHDYRLGLASSAANRPAPKAKVSFKAPAVDVKMSRWKLGRLYVVPYRLRGQSGRKALWLRVAREARLGGGRLKVQGFRERNAVVLPIPLTR